MTRLRPPVGGSDHIDGEPSALLTLTEYGDYECQSCGQAHHVVKALQEALGDRMRFVFRNFPMVATHPLAMLAAEAAEAADAQDRYWEMHDLLYANQDALEAPDLLQYATLLGLNLEQFADDLRSHRHREKVRADLYAGALSGVSGTPTFFINGVRHDGSAEFDPLWGAIAGSSGAELIG